MGGAEEREGLAAPAHDAEANGCRGAGAGAGAAGNEVGEAAERVAVGNEGILAVSDAGASASDGASVAPDAVVSERGGVAAGRGTAGDERTGERCARDFVVDVLVLALTPLVLVGCAFAGMEGSAALTLLVALTSLLLMARRFEKSKPALRQVLPTVTLAALAAAGRILFAPFPDVKPVSAIATLAGAALSPRSGFMVGALGALVSNLFFGQGPWTPWQMYAWGLVGYVGGCLGRRGWLDTVGGRTVWGLASGLLYGLFLNAWHVIGFVKPLTWASALAAFGAGLPWDLLHGAATVLFLQLIWKPWGNKLRRLQSKLG